MYGQTEATARLSYLPPELINKKKGSIGKGIPDVSLRVLKEDGLQIQPGEIGEIIATGDNIALGYWDNPEDAAVAQQALKAASVRMPDREACAAELDAQGNRQFPGGGSRLWCRFLKVSRTGGHNWEALEQSSRRFASWLDQRYRRASSPSAVCRAPRSMSA